MIALLGPFEYISELAPQNVSRDDFILYAAFLAVNKINCDFSTTVYDAGTVAYNIFILCVCKILHTHYMKARRKAHTRCKRLQKAHLALQNLVSGYHAIQYNE